MKVCFETFGCRLNRSEALSLEAGFVARGWQTTDSHAEADLIVVRGCSVTARAQHDCEKLIEHIAEKYPTKRLVVTGCMQKKRNEAILRDVSLTEVPMSTSRAYLKVQDGCSGGCTFCIVPHFRGKAQSVDFQSVLDGGRRFIDAGYREIVVTGCNLSQYNSGGRRIAALVDALASLDARCRVRVSSIEPSAAAEELVDAMADNANICRYIHLPVQSGSNLILSAMRRPYFVKTVEAIVHRALAKMPFVAIGCDLMTGFPGEHDLEALATRTLFQRIHISRAHVFVYSERPGTAAATLPDEIPVEVRRERARELSDIADRERSRFAKKMIGREVEIVVEDEQSVAGWTGEYLWCRAQHESLPRFRCKRRERQVMRVIRADGHVLVGVPVAGRV